MKETSLYYKTISNRLKEENDMSSVPLMTLHNSKRRTDDVPDSDQLSDEEDDPLESVLARMKYRPQSYKSQEFWSSVLFSGVTCFVVGFVIAYILFLSIDQNGKLLQSMEHDADPKTASVILQEISASSISKYVRTLNVSYSRKDSQDTKAVTLHQHFLSLNFDSVSPVTPSDVILSYYDRSRKNTVTIDVGSSGGLNIDLQGIINDGNANVKGTSVSTNITMGSVLYVNFGRESDFIYLESKFIFIRKNYIVLARLGKVPPLELVHRCFEKGAGGVVLFADPQQYPFIKSDTSFLSPLQLGILQKMHGNSSTEGSNYSGCLPVQTISAKDAEFILKEMSSSDPSPDSWKGNMSVSYQIGPGFSNQDWQLKMEVNMINVKKTYFSVTGTIRGSHEPDRYVLLGSSHASTVGGTASMMEVARTFDFLRANKGWRPRRSIVFCGWGFPSLEGSTNSVPLNHDWVHTMGQRAVAYLNVDIAVQGNKSLSVSTTPLLSKVVYDSSALVPNPSSTTTVNSDVLTLYDSWFKSSPSPDTKMPKINSVKGEGNFQSFLRDLGVPSLDFHFSGPQINGNNFVDEDFRYHRAIAQMWAVLTWKLADSLVVPFDTKEYATFLNNSINSINMQYEQEVKNHNLPIPQLQNAVQNFTFASDVFQDKILHLDRSKPLLTRIRNDQLLQLERAFLHGHEKTSSSSASHVVFSTGAPVNTNDIGGLNVLQDLLDDLSTSTESSEVEVRTKVETHLKSLAHCILSAARCLHIPLQPPDL